MTFQPSENILNILAPEEGFLLIESFDGRDTFGPARTGSSVHPHRFQATGCRV